MTGTGKSTLARQPAMILNVPHINLDSQLVKDQNSFVPYLRCQDIQKRITGTGPIVIVDGVCLLGPAALKRKTLREAGGTQPYG